MSLLFNMVSNVVNEVANISNTVINDLANTKPHNIIDPCSADSVIYKPSIPLCSSIPNGLLEEGTLIALCATPSPSFSKRCCAFCVATFIFPLPCCICCSLYTGIRFHIDFILEKCEHTKRHQGNSDHHHHHHNRHGDRCSSKRNTIRRTPSAASTTSSTPSGDAIIEDQMDGACLNKEFANDQSKMIAFHFNSRFAGLSERQDLVVMNSMIDGKWGDEVRDACFPFAIGKPFRMMILVEAKSFKIAVDGHHYYEFEHRLPYRDIGSIHIEGNLSVDLLEFRKELKYMSPSQQVASISTGSNGSSVQSMQVRVNSLPYTWLDKRLSDNFNLYLAGMMPTNFKRNFVINLICSKATVETIPFHMSVRPEHMSVVRNSKQDGVWFEEELYLEGPFPFVLGTHFDLMLCQRANVITVAVNGQLAFEFVHRMDVKEIDQIEITGSALVSSLRFEFF